MLGAALAQKMVSDGRVGVPQTLPSALPLPEVLVR